MGSFKTPDVEPEEIVSLMVGRDVDDLYPRSSRPANGEVVLEIKELSGLEKPKSCSLQLRRGRVLGICGLVGAGRTEMMRAIFGLDPVKSGQVKIGSFAGVASPSHRWKQGVGMVSEDRKREGLALNLSIADNITLPRLSGLGPARFVTPGRQRKASLPLIKKMEVKCTGRVSKDECSVRWQSTESGDRPFAACRTWMCCYWTNRLGELNVGSKAQIYRLIDELAIGDPARAQSPKAILIISSYLPELLGVCDEIAVMTRGELHPAEPVSHWDEEKLMLVATGQHKS